MCRFGISKLFFLLFNTSRLAKRFFINAGFRLFNVLKVSRAKVLSLLTSIIHLLCFLHLSCGWLWVAADSSSGGWIRVQLTRVPVAGYDLRLILSSGWLEFQKLDVSYSWFHPAADYELRLILSCGWFESTIWTRLAADLYFNISSKFKHVFCRINHFYGLLSTAWFQLPLIQALPAASRALKKIEEAWRSFKTLAVTDSSCSSWFVFATADSRPATNRLPPESWPRCPLIEIYA